MNCCRWNYSEWLHDFVAALHHIFQWKKYCSCCGKFHWSVSVEWIRCVNWKVNRLRLCAKPKQTISENKCIDELYVISDKYRKEANLDPTKEDTLEVGRCVFHPFFVRSIMQTHTMMFTFTLCYRIKLITRFLSYSCSYRCSAQNDACQFTTSYRDGYVGQSECQTESSLQTSTYARYIARGRDAF